MGAKLLWTGLTFISAGKLIPVPATEIVGGILMILGCVLTWFEK